ncbi:MAG TPA: rhomboid family intramembrane serine protease [Niabella sp.]|jgi:membrane associated rhomboid family serine protease|nr:rhomboid family intramembrane serine protease [Chitinophagaceae bacterium]HRO86324.1 rhomboid family intramembrane serine protease [Niabella sp.]HUN03715.1 rhomboid family intramembrane serine protease [Niabella sp.]
MSISDRNYDIRLSSGSRINPLVVLIALNMIIFVVLAFFKALSYVRFPEGSDVTGYFNQNILSLFSLSASPQSLLSHPWTILSSAFVYTAIWPLFTNMLWLWLFGYVFMDITGNRKIIPVFIYGTLLGSLAYILAGNLIPSLRVQSEHLYLFGAGPAILAIAIAATTICPNHKLFTMLNGGISLWIITVLFLTLDLATIPANNPAVHIAHLGGGIAGFLFIFLLRKGFDGSEWMNNLYDRFINMFNPDRAKVKTNLSKNTLYYKSSSVSPYKKTPTITQQKLDEILDKINQRGGFEKLTEEEKEFLKRASKEDLQGK